LSIIALIAYATLVVTASGTLRRPPLTGVDGRYLDRRSAVAWALALSSTFALPWSGAPISLYAGAGSWIWFILAGLSLAAQRNDERAHCSLRRWFAVFNAGAVMAGIYAYMFATGVPGDIPGIEGIAAINSLGGLWGNSLTAAWIFFLVSLIASFTPVYSEDDRVSSLLSFSYSSLLAIAFLPPARVFLSGLKPGSAIMADAAAYFAAAMVIHAYVMGCLSPVASAYWGRRYAAANAALTAAGIYFLLAGLR
jgi:hypothetical protein